MKIIDLHRKPVLPYLYVGRRMGGKQPLEGSPLGNPFKLRGRKPGQVRSILDEYRVWLWSKVKAKDRQILALFAEMTEETALACWCVCLEGEAIFTEPEVCHAQIVCKAFRWWKQQKEAA